MIGTFSGNNSNRWNVLWVAALFLAGCHAKTENTSPYVRVEQVDGKYWFVRGHERFLSRGVNVLEMEDSSRGDGRYYRSNFNGHFPTWYSNVVGRLQDWNFTTVAAWSHDGLCATSPFYYTRVVPFGQWNEGDTRLLDVFSEKYAAEIDYVAREHCGPRTNDVRLIGYFLNNELPWYGEHGWPTSQKVSLLSRYLELPEGSAGRLKAEEFVRIAGNDKAAQVDWAGVVAEQYYKLCAEAVRKYDPNHLVLGSRFAQRAQVPVMAACAKYCDVVSVNHYSKTGVFNEEQIGQIAALAQKPVMITEFSWRAMENSSECQNRKGADVTVATQRDRAACFKKYITAAAEQPYLVGYDWFAYHDEPPAGRFDGEDSNYGLVDIHDQPYTELLNAIREMNGRVTSLHRATRTRTPAYDDHILADIRTVVVRGTGRPLPAPVLFANNMTVMQPYGDTAGGANMKVNVPNLIFTVNGWGCGVSISANQLKTYADGSASILGATQLVIHLRAPAGIDFSPALNESGHGLPDKQAFDGVEDADGEAYQGPGTTSEDGWHEYSFSLSEFERSPYYGNQRGNETIDAQAVAQVCINFTGPAGLEKQVEVGNVEFR